MKNSLIVLGVIFVVALGAGTFIFTRNSSDETIDPKMMESSVVVGDSQKMNDSKTADTRYIEFSESVLEDTSDARRVLFFYASWCPTCRPADTDFRNNSIQIPEDVTVIRVNYNDPETDLDEEALADKYGITYQHTFVQIDSEGNVVWKWNGGGVDELLRNVR